MPIIVIVMIVTATACAYMVGHEICEFYRRQKAFKDAVLEARFERALRGYLNAVLKKKGTFEHITGFTTKELEILERITGIEANLKPREMNPIWEKIYRELERRKHGKE